jgi:hypothetical protein
MILEWGRTSGFGVDHHNLHHATEVLVSHRNAPLNRPGLGAASFFEGDGRHHVEALSAGGA